MAWVSAAPTANSPIQSVAFPGPLVNWAENVAPGATLEGVVTVADDDDESSLTIVPMPWPSAIVALAGLDRSEERRVGKASSARPLTTTSTESDPTDGENVRVPLLAT